jgi:pyruvate formate lyase activating enzyme
MTEHSKGLITDIQHFSIHDGPGIRTTVFMKGCPLKCLWCHDPESISFKPEIVYHPEFCIGCGACVSACPTQSHKIEDGQKAFERETCQLVGLCLDRCWAEALELKGREYEVAQVLEEVLEDRSFYQNSGGGVTLSGGEPLAQPDFSLNFLKAAKENYLHTVVDTSCQVQWEVLKSALPYTDLFLVDLKCFTARRHKALTGVDNELIKANLRLLDEQKAEVWVRIPLIAGCNDQAEEWEPAAEMIAGLNTDITVHLLPYHKFGEDKYSRLGKVYQLPGAQPPPTAHLDSLRRIFQNKGLRVSVKGMEKSQA